MKTGYFIDMQKLENYKKVEIKPYQELISMLMYLLCGTKSDIFFAVRQLSKYNVDLQISYLKMAKKVIYYLKNTMYLSLIYSGHFKNIKKTKAPITPFLFRLIRYRDSSYAEDLEDKKPIIGYCYLINGAAVF